MGLRIFRSVLFVFAALGAIQAGAQDYVNPIQSGTRNYFGPGQPGSQDYVTEAWTYSVYGNGSIPPDQQVATDGVGDVFQFVQAESPATNAAQHMQVIQINEARILSQVVYASNTDATPYFISVAQDVGGNPTAVYLVYGTPTTVYVENLIYLNGTLTQRWKSQLPATGLSITPKGVGVDASGNVYIASNEESSNGINYFLDLTEFDADGNQGNETTDTTMGPDHATFLNGKWYVTGFDQQFYPTGGARLSEYKQDGTYLTSDINQDFTQNGDTYRYSYLALPQSNGECYLAINIQGQNSSNQLFWEQHFIEVLNAAGNEIYDSGQRLGYIAAMAVDPSGLFYDIEKDVVNTTQEQTYVKQFLEVSDSENWSHAGPIVDLGTASDSLNAPMYLQVDISGVYAFFYAQANADALGLYRWNTAGTFVFGQSLPGNTYLASGETGNDLYFSTVYNYGGGSYLDDIFRYVPGQGLTGLTSSASTIVGSKGFHLTVNLNAPAPSGGTVINLTSSIPWALFPNGHMTYALTIPQGTQTVQVPITTLPVNQFTNATFTATDSKFVIRNVIVPLTQVLK